MIDAYADYKFNGGAQENYWDQMHHFNIDFDNEDIIQTLRKEDEEKKYSDQYQTERLYHFLLNNVFPKYNANDISWLPEHGMSELQLHLCTINIRADKDATLLDNPMYRKQALRSLIKDIITIIYDKKQVPLWNGDPQLAEKIKEEMYRK